MANAPPPALWFRERLPAFSGAGFAFSACCRRRAVSCFFRRNMTPRHHPTPDEVLAILVDEHRHQSHVDPEAEPDAVLTFDSTIAEWRSACDLLSWRGLGQALNEEWAMSLSMTEWRDLLEPAGQRTLRTLCEAISRQAQIEGLPKKGLLGCHSLEGRALRSLRAILLRLGTPRDEVRTTTPVTPLLSKHGWRFLHPCIRLAPGALPVVKHVGRIHRALLVGCVSLIIASLPLALIKAHLGAECLCLAYVIMLLLWIPHPLFRGAMVLPGITNLGDLATCLAKKRSDEKGAAPKSGPPSPTAGGAPEGGSRFMTIRFSNWLKKEIIPRFIRRNPSPWDLRIAKVFQCVVLLVLCLFALWRVLLYRDVSSQFERIRAAGYPVSGAELNDWRRPVPDPENGALVMTQAFALLRNLADARSNEPNNILYLARTNEWSAATRALVDAYVQTNAPALARAREALLLSRFRYPVDFSYGPETETPHLPGLVRIARIAALAAELDAEEGRADDWPEQVDFQLELAATLNDEPDLESWFLDVFSGIDWTMELLENQGVGPFGPENTAFNEGMSSVWPGLGPTIPLVTSRKPKIIKGQDLHWVTDGYIAGICGVPDNLTALRLETPSNSSDYYFAYDSRTRVVVPMTPAAAVEFPAFMPTGDELVGVFELYGNTNSTTTWMGGNEIKLPAKWFRASIRADGRP